MRHGKSRPSPRCGDWATVQFKIAVHKMKNIIILFVKTLIIKLVIVTA